MMMQRFLVFTTLVSCVLLLVGSCKDIGNEVPPPPKPLTAGRDSLNLVPGEIAATKLSGGTPPYSLVSPRGDTSVAIPSIDGDSLRVRAKAVGRITIVVGDNGSPRLTDTVRVAVKQLAVGKTSFNLLTGDTASTTISGGTPPYSIVSNSDSTKVSTSISGSLLRLQALFAGSAMIIVGDNGSPRLTDTVNINIVASVLFSSQIQPIFTSSCAVPGCHLPGGIGPMSLAVGESRGNLVGIPATNGIGQCPGVNRVEPSNAEASVLVKRITGTCGLAQMPLGRTPLSSGQIQLIRDWINQGARNN